MDNMKTFDATPSYKLLDTMGYGTYSLETAVADIVDNSITALASHIEINFVWKENNNSYVEIRDDGFGMNGQELQNAMIFSGKGMNDYREENDLGKYGLGMKTASLYACRRLTVISKKEGYRMTAKRLDSDVVVASQKWIGIDLDHVINEEDYHLEHGTIVRWENLTFIEKGINSKKYFYKHAQDVMDHLEIVFHRFVEKGVVISINGNPIKPWNPICRHEATTKVESQNLKYNGYVIRVNSYLMPSSFSCTEEEIDHIYRGNALKYQGFYVYRNDRLLVDGGWLDIHRAKTKLSPHQSFNAVRITVDIPSKLDSVFKVDFTKSSINFPLEIEEQLFKIAQTARNRAKSLSKKRTYTPLVRANKVDEIWKTKRKDTEISFSINKDHPLIKSLTKDMTKKDFNELMKLLSKTVPYVSGERKFVASFTKEEMDNLIQSYYIEQLLNNKSKEVIYQEMASMEPYNEYMELVNAFFEQLRTSR